MRRRVKILSQVTAFLLAIAAPCLLAAQVGLDDQLKAQYQLVKMGADSSGPAVIEQGTLLKILKGGILSVPYNDVSVTPTKYQNGQIHSPNALVQKGLGSLMRKVGQGTEHPLLPGGRQGVSLED